MAQPATLSPYSNTGERLDDPVTPPPMNANGKNNTNNNNEHNFQREGKSCLFFCRRLFKCPHLVFYFRHRY